MASARLCSRNLTFRSAELQTSPDLIGLLNYRTTYGFALRTTLDQLGLVNTLRPNLWPPRLTVFGTAAISRSNRSILEENAASIAENSAELSVAFRRYDRQTIAEILAKLALETVPKLDAETQLSDVLLAVATPLAQQINPGDLPTWQTSSRIITYATLPPFTEQASVSDTVFATTLRQPGVH